MADVFDDGEFWLPSQFLSDDAWLLQKEYTKTITNGNTNNQKGFTKDVFGVPYNFPADPSSPVDPAANDMSSVGHEYSNAWPSKLCQVGTGCGCRGPTTTGLSNPKVSSASPQATWDLLYAAAAAGEVTKMKLDEEAPTYGNQVSNGSLLMGPTRDQFYPNRNHKSSTPSATDIVLYHKLQALRLRQLRQQQILKRQQQGVAYLYHLRHKQGASLLAGPALSPFSRPQQQPKHFGSAMRPAFLENLPAKKERTGTGVFLPRRAADTPKKTGCSTRVAQAMNLNLEDTIVSQQLYPMFSADNAVYYPASKSVQCVDAADLRIRGSNGKRSFRSQPPVICTDVGLPQEWTY